jgi:hypothetical protein
MHIQYVLIKKSEYVAEVWCKYELNLEFTKQTEIKGSKLPLFDALVTGQ